MTDLDRLRRALPPPEEPVDTADAQAWSSAESVLGIRLPTDYRLFLEQYGSGEIDGFLRVLNPGATPEYLRLVEANERQLDLLRWLRNEGTEVPAVFPEPSGVLLCAETANGDCVYWRTEPRDEPDAWQITANEARGPDWFDHTGPLTDSSQTCLSAEFAFRFCPIHSLHIHRGSA